MSLLIPRIVMTQEQQISSKPFVLFSFFILLFTTLCAQAQQADSINDHGYRADNRVRNIALVSGAAYGAALYGLNKAWYEEFPRTKFHFFNDNAEWKQLDKAGHFYSAFHISQASIHLLQKAGITQKKANFWGGMMGFLILAPIEILDGYSAQYGASWGDLVANAVGSGTAMAQYMIWNEARIKPKYSFTPTSLAAKRPNVLGDGFHEEFLKDYNGQTYWLSIDVYAFLPSRSKFPKWLNFVFGYGVENIVYANDQQNLTQGYNAHRQYYFGIDFDLSHFTGKSKVVNTLIYVVDLIHLPAPTLEYNRSGGLKFHFLKF